MGGPRCVQLDKFMLHNEGETTDRNIYVKRRIRKELWEEMKKKKMFTFDIMRGFHNCDVGSEPFTFPMADFLLFRSKGRPLSEILGPTTRIVTKRSLLRDLLAIFLDWFPRFLRIEIACERFGDVIFIKNAEGKKHAGFDFLGPDLHYKDMRLQFFDGDDQPGCVGKEPVEGFTFPKVGWPYEVLALDHGPSRIMFSANIRHFTPDGDVADSSLVPYSLDQQKRLGLAEEQMDRLIIKSLTTSSKESMFFHIDEARQKMKVEFVPVDEYLEYDKKYQAALNSVCEMLLDKRLRNFLAVRRACTATLEMSPNIHFEPVAIDPKKETYTSQRFKAARTLFRRCTEFFKVFGIFYFFFSHANG